MRQALQGQDYTADFKDYMLLQLAVPAGRIVVMQASQRRTPGP
jgi:hypothetical protein